MSALIFLAYALGYIFSPGKDAIKLVVFGGKPQICSAESSDPRVQKEIARSEEKKKRDLRREELRQKHRIEHDSNRIFVRQVDLFWKEMAREYNHKNKVPKFKPHTKGTPKNFYRRQ
jgi:hypothetical protein